MVHNTVDRNFQPFLRFCRFRFQNCKRAVRRAERAARHGVLADLKKEENEHYRMPKFEHSVTTVRDDESEPIILEFYANNGSRISVSALKSPPAPDDTGNDEARRTPDDSTQNTDGGVPSEDDE